MSSDAHMQGVMLAKSSGFSDISSLLLSALQKKLGSANDSSDDEKEKLLKISLSNDAVNEFADNPRILSCAFPWLFPLGVTEEELGEPGTVSEGVVRRLFCSYDNRFAISTQFLFLLANQKMRHSACKAVSFKLRDESDEVKSFLQLVNQPNFPAKLKRSIDVPGNGEGKQILKEMMHLINITGSKIPWGPLERRMTTSHLYSIAQSCSAPFLFVTFS